MKQNSPGFSNRNRNNNTLSVERNHVSKGQRALTPVEVRRASPSPASNANVSKINGNARKDNAVTAQRAKQIHERTQAGNVTGQNISGRKNVISYSNAGRKNSANRTFSVDEESKSSNALSEKRHHSDSSALTMLASEISTRQDSFPDECDGNQSPKCLILVSSKCKYAAVLEKAVKRNVIAVLYNYDVSTLDSLLALIIAALGSVEKVQSVACMMPCKHACANMIHDSENQGVLNSTSTIVRTSGIGQFFDLLYRNYVDVSHPDCRLDLLGAGVVNQIENTLHAIEKIIGVPVVTSKEILGTDTTVSMKNGDKCTLGEIYFTPDKIRNWSNGSFQSIDLFEKIRMVGKGYFGNAVLYRKKDDNSLVILKEINLTELNSQERSLAMNETKVLKMLNHPNIICYYDSFEEDGVLMIEMEYADDGTLAQYLAKQEETLEESVIVNKFSQIISGIRYMHEQQVLHRDLKTANIFLTKEGCIKIGDFGVSKLLSTQMKDANTVLGTPYYISPEICEGKPYNEKSDIWALGCILHEMATRQKTFEGTNLPALVNKIMKGQIAPIQGNFSHEFIKLVYDMLHKYPEMRPTAHTIDLDRLPEIKAKLKDVESDTCLSSSMTSGRSGGTLSLLSQRETRSVLYLYDTSALTISPVDGFSSMIKIRQVAVGKNHMVVVSMERTVYAWGQAEHGQLGHGSLDYYPKPQIVEALKGKSIIAACCGSSFSGFMSDNGIVMTCGDGQYGCLGHGGYSGSLKPKLIESLLGVDIVSICCGPSHVVTLSSEGVVFAWGNSKHGCLGVGTTEIYDEPVEVSIGDGVTVRDVKCGYDGTIFITDVGTLLACGNNRHNKLGLNERRGFLTLLSNKLKKLEVENKKTPTAVKAIKGVVDVAMGKNHTAVYTDMGCVYIFGSNKDGQMGTGDNKFHSSPYLVKGLKDCAVNMVICGNTYSAAGTEDGGVYFWGTRSKLMLPDNGNNAVGVSGSNSLVVKPTHRRTHSGTSTMSYRSDMSVFPDNCSASDGPSRASSYQDINYMSERVLDILNTDGSKLGFDIDLESNVSSVAITGSSPDTRLPGTVFSPIAILNIKRSDNLLATGSCTKPIFNENSTSNAEQEASGTDFSAVLVSLIPFHDSFYMLVETNSPQPSTDLTLETENTMTLQTNASSQSSNNLSVPQRITFNSTSSNEVGDEYTSSENSELDSFGTAPTWIIDELKNAHIKLKNVANEKPEDKSDISTDGSIRRKNKPSRGRSSLPTNKSLTRSSVSNKKPSRFSPSPSRSSSQRKCKGADPSSSDSSSQLSRKQKSLSVDSASSSARRRSTSPRDQRMPQASKNRLSLNKSKDSFVPKPSRSPVRGRVKDQDLHSRYMQLQKEKQHTEQKLKQIQEQNEQQIKEMKTFYEKEKFAQEQKLQSEIAALRQELERQRFKESSNGVLKHSRQSMFQDSGQEKNSKICSIQ